MSKELVISTSRHETRVAVIEDDQIVEIYHQRENEYSLAGSIHKGRVTRVLPGMQSAFVDIGLERDAFLYVSDFFEDNDEYDKIVTSVEEKVFKQLDRDPSSVTAAPVVVASSPETAGTDAPQAAVEAAVPGEQPAATAPAPERRDERRSDGRGDARGDARPEGRNDGRGDDRRGGRRSRRRRGGKGGNDRRGLPDSKFYSPRPEYSSSAPAASTEPAELEESAAGPAEDMLVLPGESLAKYTGPESGEDFERFDSPEEPEGDTPAAAPLETEADPQPVLAAALAESIAEREEETAAHATMQTEPEPPASQAAPPAVFEEPVAEPPAEIAEDVDVEPTDAAEPLEAEETAAEETATEDAAEETAEESESELHSTESDEASEPSAEGGEELEAAAEPEGPEPARIPTSLTATLREQGQNPRLVQQHRMSRRGRRNRGRDGRDNRAPAGEGQPRGPQQYEPREQRPPQDRSPEPRTAPRAEGRSDRPPLPSISDLLKEGQEIIVQIAKEPLGQKGARITSHIALPGRFLVYMPTVDHIGVSRKIPSDDERLRLKRVLQTHRTGIPGGYIVRTAGDGRTEEELRADMMFLYNMWLDMRQKAERRPAPLLIHHDLNVVERILRDQLTSSFKSIWVDNEEVYESVLRFVQRFQPALVGRVKLYTRSTPLFEEFGVTSELEKALRPKVWLKSGGYIVINQTEALVAIDINTGKYVGKSNRLEDTIVKTNTDAIKEIVRQIRLRDLGGIIVVDFIDMDERKNRQKVMQALEEAMRADRAPYKILQFNDFGLVAITRKRVKQSLERTLCTPCPYCEGAGYVKSPQTVIGEILQEATKYSKVVEGKDVMLRVNPEVARLLKSNQNSYLQELEEILGRPVFVKSDNQLHQEKFDLA
jgi:ribonuclease G